MQNRVDETEFVALIEKYQNIIHKICRVYFSTAEEREDMFQEVVLQLWKSYPKFRKESKFSTWLYRVALNTALIHVNKNKKKPQHDSLTHQDHFIGENQGNKLEQKEEVRNLYKAIGKLSNIEKAIILLYLEEKSYEEIADIVGITLNHVGVKINRIKTKLEKIIHNHFEYERI